MKYVSIDIETTGIDPEKHQILEFGAIIEDTENKLSFDDIPKFKRVIYHKEIKGSLVALDMNARILHILAEYEKKYDKFTNDKLTAKEVTDFAEENGILTINSLAIEFYTFLQTHFPTTTWRDPITITPAGKNFGSFDSQFLKRIEGFSGLIKFKHRALDPAILCVDWKNDSELPSLGECKKRTAVSGEVTHDALEDAWDVIQVLRKSYHNE